MNQIKIGEFIKALRKAKGLSQQQLADDLYVTQKTISRWENGDGTPDISILSDVAKYFEITVDELLDGERKIVEQSESTNRRKEKDRTNFLNRKIVQSSTTLLSISLAIGGLFTLIGMILGTATYNELLALFLLIIGVIIPLIIYLVGSKRISNNLLDEEEFNNIDISFIKINLRKNNLLFSDVIAVFSLITILMFGFMVYIHNPGGASGYWTEMLTYFILSALVYGSYFAFRPLIKKESVTKVDVMKRIATSFSIIIFLPILFLTELTKNQSQVIDSLPGFFAIFEWSTSNFIYRLFGTLLIVASIVLIIIFTVKKKFIFTFFSAIVGLIGIFLMPFDHYLMPVNELEHFFGYSVRFNLSALSALIIAIALAIAYLVLFIQNRKANKKTSTID